MTGLAIDVHRLAKLFLESFRAGGPVVSLYLAREPGSGASTHARLRELVKEGEAAIQGEKALEAPTRQRARTALETAAAAIEQGAEAHPGGTWVAFAGDDGPETFHVPCTLRSRVAIGEHAYVGPLVGLLENSDRYGVVLVDHRDAKILSYFLGDLEELGSLADPSLQNIGWAGWLGRDQLKANHHREVIVHRHLQHAADALFAHHKRSPFDRIVLLAGPPPAILSKLERSLHPYLAARVVARESWEPRTTRDELRACLAEIAERVESEKEKRLISSLRDHLSGDLHATTGVDATLSALWAGRVATLVVPDGARLAGRACEKCRFLAAETGEAARCRSCGEPTHQVEDLVEEASELAVLTGAKVRRVARAKGELEALGGLASLLRYV